MSDADLQRSVAKPLLIGCGVVVVSLLLCGGLAVFLGTRGVQMFQAEVKRAAEDEEFALRWRAPASDAPEGAFSPESIAGFELASSDENAAFPALGIERDGRHAVYKNKKGNETIEISIYRANEAETSAIFDELIRRIDEGDRFKSRSHVRLPRSLRFSVSDPVDLNGVLWHAGGWLVFVRSATVKDLDPFLREYLTAIEREDEEASSGGPVALQKPDPAGEELGAE